MDEISIRKQVNSIKTDTNLNLISFDEKKRDYQNKLIKCVDSKLSTEFKDECYLEFGPVIGDHKLCSKIGDNLKRTKCLSLMAEINQEYKPCELIIREFSFYWDLINNTEGTEEYKTNLAREKISIDQKRKDICYENLARVTGDITFCQNIDQKFKKDICIKENV